MERSLFSFIWKHSKRDQLLLLVVTLALFPLLFLTLELPKRIINDAIGAKHGAVDFLSIEVSQVTYLFVLCALFLLAVLAHGLMKMRINTLKGSLSERLLRRLRYTLIARTLRFPAPYFERTSQGELVSMVTSETEPMGGLMGDMMAQPVLQAGQMITIVGFLFAQSTVFGFAACALIPLQAWLIPRLQKRVNLLNKQRVVQVRALAADIGESAVGAATLRLHGGWRYRLSLFSERLEKLYALRLEIFRKKFFMKFLNNFIGQLTPFFFYAIGGYLAIKGEVSIGALVAALAAYKDLSSPWKELLTYYNQHQDLSLRWKMVTERFDPPQMVDATLFDGQVEHIPSLKGDIELSGVTVQSEDGETILDNMTTTLHAGKRIAISAQSAEERTAFGSVLTREIFPQSGTISIAGHTLDGLHQSVLASRIGHASSNPVLFSGSLKNNVLMALLEQQTDWVPPASLGVSNDAEMLDWWLEITKAIGSDDTLLRYGLDLRMARMSDPSLGQDIVGLRSASAAAIAAANLDGVIWPFDEAIYNPALPVIDNLLFATPKKPLTASVLAEQTEFLDLLAELDLEDGLIQLAVDLVDLIRQIFGVDGANHPLFRRFKLDSADYETALGLAATLGKSKRRNNLQKAQLLIVPFSISADVIGSSFPEDISKQVVEMRASHGAVLRASMAEFFAPLSADQPVASLSIFENALFGKVSQTAGRKADEAKRVISEVIKSAGLEKQLLGLVLDAAVSREGKNLSVEISETLAVSRAAIKRPDVLILDTVMRSQDVATRDRMYTNLGRLLPHTTIVGIEASFEGIDGFDVYLNLKQGRISDTQEETLVEGNETLIADQAAKMRILHQSKLFGTLDRKQLRLLAFGSQWHQAKAGEYLFYKGDDPSSGAYLIFEGEADLLQPTDEGAGETILQVGPGELVGELGLIGNVPRALDMRATTDMKSLRIGSEAFLAVVENDAATAFALLRVVASYVRQET